MIDLISKINKAVNDVVWGWPAMILILGVGLYLTFGSGGIQFRKFGVAMKETIGKVLSKTRSAAGKGALTPWQAVCTALAATVGTGNVAGVAGAICLGGPGAIFWMWISALLGMCTKMAEVTLAVHFRKKNEKGEWTGGPMYYIENGLHCRWLAILFAAFAALAAFGIGNATQVGSIRDSINSAIETFGGNGSDILNLILGIILAAIIMLITVGGIRRIAQVTEKLVPIMAIFYIVLGLGVVVIHIDRVPGVLADIVRGAFDPKAVTGGVIGTVIASMQRGISRGIFSNEAGLGSAPIAHATADTDSPVKQGLFGVFEVFMDTIVICTMTALIVLCAGKDPVYGQSAGAELTISSFTETYGGWSSVFGAVAIICFAFSTIIGWSLYGQRCVEYIFGPKAVTPYLILYSLVCILGATVDLGVVWSIADTLNGLMAIPNLIAVILLSPIVFRLMKEYFAGDRDIKKAAEQRQS